MKLKELTAASETFDRALHLAKLLKDRAAENAIRRAIDDINCTLAKRPLQQSQSGRCRRRPRRHRRYVTRNQPLAVWRSGSVVRRMNEVTLR